MHDLVDWTKAVDVQALLDSCPPTPTANTWVMHPVLLDRIRALKGTAPPRHGLMAIQLRESLYLQHDLIACFDEKMNLVRVIKVAE